MATKVCDKTFVGDSGGFHAVEFVFTNGKKLVCDSRDLPANMQAYAMCHGISARVGDSFAGAAKQDDPVGWAYDTACEVWHAMVGGEWSHREATGGVLAQALAMVSGKPLETCQQVVGALDEERRAKLRKQPKIKLALAKIAVDRATVAAANSTFEMPS